jgi:hypothetical protein
MDNNSWSKPEGFIVTHRWVFFKQIIYSFTLYDANLLGNSSCSGRLIACNHDNLDTCRLALFNGFWDRLLWRILHGNNPEEGEAFKSEV